MINERRIERFSTGFRFGIVCVNGIVLLALNASCSFDKTQYSRVKPVTVDPASETRICAFPIDEEIFS